MPTLDWLNRDAAFRVADRVPTRVLRPHAASAEEGNVTSGNLLVQDGSFEAWKVEVERRIAAIEAGGAKLIPWETAKKTLGL